MNPTLICRGLEHILYDADTIAMPALDLFNHVYHRDRRAIIAKSQGRGTTWYFTLHGRHFVLRHYRRGGMIAPLLGDRYVWSGLTKNRAFKEWRLLAQCAKLGLPVPRPLAARVVRRGIVYRADIITQQISDSNSLAEVLIRAPVTASQWQLIGQSIRRFHDVQIYHADLNAHNILIDSKFRVYLIDFDKGMIGRHGHHWQQSNLSRLHRSLIKLKQSLPSFNFSSSDFEYLKAGYGDKFR